jgi:hypothetical protein
MHFNKKIQKKKLSLNIKQSSDNNSLNKKIKNVT